jgi:tryptophan synthase beta chain
LHTQTLAHVNTHKRTHKHSHALAYAKKIAKSMRQDETIVVTLSGRGDKDVESIANLVKV